MASILYFLVVVVDSLEERVHELDRHGPGPDRERAELERRRSATLRSHLDDERHVLLGRNRFNQKKGQLGIDRLELNLVHLIVDDGRERSDRFRIPGLAQQTDCADTNLRIGIAKIPDHVLELGWLLSNRDNRRSDEDCGNEDHQPYKSGHERSSGGPNHCNRSGQRRGAKKPGRHHKCTQMQAADRFRVHGSGYTVQTSKVGVPVRDQP